MTAIVNHANIFPISICLFEAARLYGVTATGSKNMAEIDALVERIDELDATVRKIERIVSKGQNSTDKRKRRWLDSMHHKIERIVSKGQRSANKKTRRWLDSILHFADLAFDKACNVLFALLVGAFLLFLLYLFMS